MLGHQGSPKRSLAALALLTLLPVAGCAFDRSGLAMPDPDACCSGTCGDGIVDQGEGCDDGNQSAGDGCSAACQVEPGWTCQGEPSLCVPGCGNGTIDTGEECDGAELGGASCLTVPGDFSGGTLSCDASCRLDTTWCIPSTCGTVVVPGPDDQGL